MGRAKGAPCPPAASPGVCSFGSRGQWVITGASSVVLSQTSYNGSGATYSSVTFAPGLDTFVLRNFSVGLTLSLGFSDSKGYTADGTFEEDRLTTYAGGLRAGLVVPLSRRVSLYPRLAAGYESIRAGEQDLTPSATSTLTAGATATVAHDGPWATADAPLLLQAAPHFFVAVVPSVTVDGSSGPGEPPYGGPHVSAGAGFELGGWFGGPEPASAAEPVEPRDPVPDLPPRAPLPVFGDAGVLALNAELEAYGSATTYGGGTSASSSAYGLQVGADYFVASHFSFGAVLTLTHSESSGAYLLGGAPYRGSHDTDGVGARVGVEIRLGTYVSIWPRGTFGFAVDGHDIESQGQANKGNDSRVFADLYVPLLVHPARHFFVGFGPDAYTDLSRTVTPGNGSNPANSYGAGLIVGGWL